MSSAALTILGVSASIWGKSSSWSVKATGVLAVAFLILAVLMTIVDLKKEIADLKLAIEKSKPKFQSAIERIMQNELSEDGELFVYARILNLSDGVSPIESVVLRNQENGDNLKAISFRQRTFATSEIQINRTIDREAFRRMMGSMEDLLPVIRSTPLSKGQVKEGWLLFPKSSQKNLTSTLPLSLRLEDMHRNLHDSEVTNIAFEFGKVFK